MIQGQATPEGRRAAIMRALEADQQAAEQQRARRLDIINRAIGVEPEEKPSVMERAYKGVTRFVDRHSTEIGHGVVRGATSGLTSALQSAGVVQGRLTDTPPEQTDVFALGTGIQEAVTEEFPGLPGTEGSFGRQLSEGAGQLAVQIPIAGAKSIPAAIRLAILATQSVSMQGMESYHAAKADPEATDEDAWKAFFVSAPMGGLDMLLPKTLTSRAAASLSRVDRATGGGVRRFFTMLAKRAVNPMGVEGGTEFTQALWDLVVAKALYDDDPTSWGEIAQIGREAAAGGILGGLASGLVDTIDLVKTPTADEKGGETPRPYDPTTRQPDNLTPEEVEQFAASGGLKAAGVEGATTVLPESEVEKFVVEEAAKRGKRVVFADSGEARKTPGAQIGDFLVLDPRASEKAQISAVFSHEVTHSAIESVTRDSTTRPEVVQSIREALEAVLGPEVFEKAKTMYQRGAKAAGLDVPATDLEEEGVAVTAEHLAGPLTAALKSPEAIKRLAVATPNLVQKLGEAIFKAANRTIGTKFQTQRMKDAQAAGLGDLKAEEASKRADAAERLVGFWNEMLGELTPKQKGEAHKAFPSKPKTLALPPPEAPRRRRLEPEGFREEEGFTPPPTTPKFAVQTVEAQESAPQQIARRLRGLREEFGPDVSRVVDAGIAATMARTPMSDADRLQIIEDAGVTAGQAARVLAAMRDYHDHAIRRANNLDSKWLYGEVGAIIGRHPSTPKFAVDLDSGQHKNRPGEAKEPWQMTRLEWGRDLVQRIDEPDAPEPTPAKPHGLYTTRADVLSPHADLGGSHRVWRRNPDARILDVSDVKPAEVIMREGASGAGAGVQAAYKLLGKSEFGRLRSLSRKELNAYAEQLGPGVDYAKYYDRQEVMEAIGANLARNSGFDAIADYNEETFRDPFSEYVAVTDNALLGMVATHKEEVQRALSEGRPVPPEVLADYPDLNTHRKFAVILDTGDTVAKRTRRRRIDSLSEIEDLVKQAKGLGISISDEANPELLLRTRASRIHDQLERAKLTTLKEVADGLKAVKRGGLSEDEVISLVSQYREALAAPGRNRKILARDPKNTAGSNISDADAAATITALSKHPKIEAIKRASAALDALSDARLKILVDAEIIDQKTADRWKAEEPHYVPFKNDREVIRDAVRRGYGPLLKDALGRHTKADDSTTFAVLDYKRAIVAAADAEIKRSALDLARKVNDPDFAKEGRPITRRLNHNTQQVETVQDIFDNDRTVMVPVKGHLVPLTFGKEFQGIANVFKGTGNGYAHPGDVEVAMTVLRAITRVLSQINTRFSPNFVLAANPLRDPWTAAIGSRIRYGNKISNQIMREMFSGRAGREVRALFKDRASAGPIADRWAKAGGPIERMGVRDFETVQADLQKAMQDGDNAAVSTLKAADMIGRVLENRLRYATFKTLVNHGWSDLKAAVESKEITVNFERRGDVQGFLTAGYTFSGASIAGLDNTYRLLRDMPRRFARVVGQAAAFVALVNIYNWLMSEEDELGNNTYARHLASRSRGVPIMLPGGGGLAGYIPTPPGLGWFLHLGNLATDIALHKTTDGKLGRGFKDSAVDALAAAFEQGNFLGGGSGTLGRGVRQGDLLEVFYGLAQAITPSVFKPVTDAIVNRDWRGMWLRPEASKDTPRSKQAFADASETYKSIAEWMAENAKFELPPGVYENTARMAGGPYRTIEQIARSIEEITGGKGGVAGVLTKAPITSAVIKGPSDREDAANFSRMVNDKEALAELHLEATARAARAAVRRYEERGNKELADERRRAFIKRFNEAKKKHGK